MLLQTRQGALEHLLISMQCVECFVLLKLIAPNLSIKLVQPWLHDMTYLKEMRHQIQNSTATEGMYFFFLRPKLKVDLFQNSQMKNRLYLLPEDWWGVYLICISHGLSNLLHQILGQLLFYIICT